MGTAEGQRHEGCAEVGQLHAGRSDASGRRRVGRDLGGWRNHDNGNDNGNDHYNNNGTENDNALGNDSDHDRDNDYNNDNIN